MFRGAPNIRTILAFFDFLCFQRPDITDFLLCGFETERAHITTSQCAVTSCYVWQYTLTTTKATKNHTHKLTGIPMEQRNTLVMRPNKSARVGSQITGPRLYKTCLFGPAMPSELYSQLCAYSEYNNQETSIRSHLNNAGSPYQMTCSHNSLTPTPVHI